MDMKTKQDEIKELMDRDELRGFLFIVITCLTIFSAVAVLIYLELKGVHVLG